MKNATWKNRVWFFIVAFFITIILDWGYIYCLAQEANIIDHWVIVSPIIMTLFLVLTLFASMGIYLKKRAGFYSAYIITCLSAFFIIFSYEVIETNFIVQISPIILIVFLNFLFSLGLIFFQIESKQVTS